MPTILGLDIGEKRIGVAQADEAVKIASPLTTLSVDGTEKPRLHQLIKEHNVVTVVVGLPRNAEGETTAQTKAVEMAVKQLELDEKVQVVWQDESLTSVKAETELAQTKPNYQKTDVDVLAATYILEDFLRSHHG